MSPFFLCYLICFRKINYLCMPFIKWLYIIFRVERKLNGRGGGSEHTRWVHPAKVGNNRCGRPNIYGVHPTQKKGGVLAMLIEGRADVVVCGGQAHSLEEVTSR